MNLLALDTSTQFASIALYYKGALTHRNRLGERNHAQFILPAIKNLLDESGCSLASLDGIVYGQGPGSFTGLRVTCSIVKGLGFAQGLTLFPVSSLAAIAYEVWGLAQVNSAVLTIIDARMNQIYWSYFRDKEDIGSSQVSDADRVVIPTDLPLIVAGTNYEPYLTQLPSAIQAQISRHFTVYPDARAMIKRVQNGTIEAQTAAEALPIYLRNQIAQGDSYR